MRKIIHIICSLMILGGSVVVLAQDPDIVIERIRKQYDDVSNKARLAESDEEQGQTGEMVMNELSVNKLDHQWRAVGIYGENFKFFYKGGDSEEHMYPDQLVLVKVSRRSSVRVYSEEFLYDKAGRLIFYFQMSENDEQMPVERRIYFDAGKPVRIIEDKQKRDRLSSKDRDTARDASLKSVRIKEVFSRSIKL